MLRPSYRYSGPSRPAICTIWFFARTIRSYLRSPQPSSWTTDKSEAKLPLGGTEVSDDLYGSGSRYVSKQRLEAMLDNEWTQLLTQLSKTRGQQTRFFCFVDTVSAR